jgi:hypothetical protein
VTIDTYPDDTITVGDPMPAGLVRWVWREIARGMDERTRYLAEGCASTGALNANGVVHDIDGAILPERVPLLAAHSWLWPIGCAWLRRVHSWIEFRAEFAPKLPGAGACWSGIVDGHAACVSIGCDFLIRRRPYWLSFAPDEAMTYSMFRVSELSLCTRGANPDAFTWRRWREPRRHPSVLLTSPWEQTS